MRKTTTLRELNKELSQLYKRLRPKEYNPHWSDIPENRKQIDALLNKKYVGVKE